MFPDLPHQRRWPSSLVRSGCPHESSGTRLSSHRAHSPSQASSWPQTPWRGHFLSRHSRVSSTARSHPAACCTLPQTGQACVAAKASCPASSHYIHRVTRWPKVRVPGAPPFTAHGSWDQDSKPTSPVPVVQGPLRTQQGIHHAGLTPRLHQQHLPLSPS